MTGRIAIVLAGVFGAVGVGMGAYHAHGLEKFFERTVAEDEIPGRMENAEVAVRYQLMHAIALLAVGAVAGRRSSNCLSAATLLFAAGVVLFSGGLYLFVFTGNIGHPAIIPVGGVMMMTGWLFVFVHACCCWPAKTED